MQPPHVSTGIKKAREAAARQEALQREQGPATTRQAFGELSVPNKPPHDWPTPAQQNVPVSLMLGAAICEAHVGRAWFTSWYRGQFDKPMALSAGYL